MLTKAQDDILKGLRPKPKDIHFTVLEEWRNQKIFTFKKLKADNFDFVFPGKLVQFIDY